MVAACVLFLGGLALAVVSLVDKSFAPLGGFGGGFCCLSSLVITRLNNKIHEHRSKQ